MKKRLKIFLCFFIILVISELFVISTPDIDQYRLVSKPAILLSLLLFYAFNSRHLKWEARIITILALGLSLFGDTLLLFENENSGFFIAGLISFLLAHICYIIVFSKDRHPKKYKYIFFLMLAAYSVFFFQLIHEGLSSMLIPVLMYVLVILGMVSTAFLRRLDPLLSYNLILGGAFLFLISDSLLAYNKFYSPVENANIWIMFTYAMAQLCIVIGLIYSRRISFIREIQEE